MHPTFLARQQGPGPTKINQDGSFYSTQRIRISSSATQNGVLCSGCFKIAPPPPPQKKSQFNHCQTVLLFQWFTDVHSCITANTLQDSDSQENHNELYI